MEWISVEDRLPEVGGLYLAFNPNNCGAEPKLKMDIYRFAKYNNSWYWGADCFHPTHWMPLPEPPNK